MCMINELFLGVASGFAVSCHVVNRGFGFFRSPTIIIIFASYGPTVVTRQGGVFAVEYASPLFEIAVPTRRNHFLH